MEIKTNYRAKYYNTTARSVDNLYIVLHYTANGGTTATAKANANYFANTTTVKASAHYIVDDTEIYNTVPVKFPAYAVGDTQKYTHGGAYYKGTIKNNNSISIEMVSHSNVRSPQLMHDDYYIDEATIKNTVWLVRYLMSKYNIPSSRVVRHYDVTGKCCPDCMCCTEKGNLAWTTFLSYVKTGYPNNDTKPVEADNSPSSWAAEIWKQAISDGVTDGTNPKSYVTREQALTLVYRKLRNSPTTTINDAWTQAKSAGYTDGTNPTSYTKRKEVITFICRIANDRSSETIESACAWAINNKITDGTNLDDYCTREQLIVMLYRL